MSNSLKQTIVAISALLPWTFNAHAQTTLNPIIADLDQNGRISRSEAENMMNTPALKSKLFNASPEEQGRFYNGLDNNIPVPLLKLSRV